MDACGMSFLFIPPTYLCVNVCRGWVGGWVGGRVGSCRCGVVAVCLPEDHAADQAGESGQGTTAPNWPYTLLGRLAVLLVPVHSKSGLASTQALLKEDEITSGNTFSTHSTHLSVCECACCPILPLFDEEEEEEEEEEVNRGSCCRPCARWTTVAYTKPHHPSSQEGDERDPWFERKTAAIEGGLLPRCGGGGPLHRFFGGLGE